MTIMLIFSVSKIPKKNSLDIKSNSHIKKVKRLRLRISRIDGGKAKWKDKVLCANRSC